MWLAVYYCCGCANRTFDERKYNKKAIKNALPCHKTMIDLVLNVVVVVVVVEIVVVIVVVVAMNCQTTKQLVCYMRCIKISERVVLQSNLALDRHVQHHRPSMMVFQTIV
jgi:hypothetical protein